jgi:hypothetical protein
MMTSAIAKAATKAIASVKANALSKFTSWAHVCLSECCLLPARSQNARLLLSTKWAACLRLPSAHNSAWMSRGIGDQFMQSTSSLWAALALLAVTVIAYVATPPLRLSTVAACSTDDRK